MTNPLDRWVASGEAVGDSDCSQVPEVCNYHPNPNGKFKVKTILDNGGDFIKIEAAAPPWSVEAKELMGSLKFALKNSGGVEYLLAEGDPDLPEEQVLSDFFWLKYWQITKENIERTDVNGDLAKLNIFLETLTWVDIRSGDVVGRTFWRW